eukprot:3177682-Prymnesium_polylepis.1
MKDCTARRVFDFSKTGFDTLRPSHRAKGKACRSPFAKTRRSRRRDEQCAPSRKRFRASTPRPLSRRA